MLLSDWRLSWLAYRFDRDCGRYHRRLVRLGIHLRLSGFAAIENTREHGKLLFCLYRWEGRIVFQAGTRRWPLDQEGLRFQFRPLDGKTSEFSVFERDALAFRCSYRHWLRVRVRLRLARTGEDAAEDTVDFERDHFLAHVAGQVLPAPDIDAWEDGHGETPPPASVEAPA